MRPMDCRVTRGAILGADARLGVWAQREILVEFHVEYISVALETQLSNGTAFEHLGVVRTVRGVTRRTSLNPERGVFKDERSLHL